MASSLLFIPWWIPSMSSIYLVLLSLGWIPLSDEFMASYLLVDSLSCEVRILL